ncbi:MAG: hypothetical protein AAF738_09065, partial [Bacteroidota bacterium]
MSTVYRKICLLAVFIGLQIPATLFAQIEDVRYPKTPYSFQAPTPLKARTAVDTKNMPAIDLPSIQKQDAIDDANGVVPMRFGIEHDVNYNLKNSGTWETLANGDRLWRLQIHAPQALSINLVYSNFYIPSGGR